MSQKKIIPITVDDYEELNVTVVGNVDAGKSTTIGVLTNVENRLDDGDGLLRATVSRHPHEITSGRTSDIAYKYYVDNELKKIINLVDLAGHKKYLKTTITGLCSENPDVSIVCISDNFPPIAKEHLSLCLYLGIKIIIVFTKIDIISEIFRKNICIDINKIISKYKNKKLFKITEEIDFKNLNDNLIPVVEISNKTGTNIPLLKKLIASYNKVPHYYDELFTTDRTHNIPGIGIVVTGVAGKKINIDDKLLIGPIDGEFLQIKIKSIHNNYYTKINTLLPGQYGCLNISGKKILRNMIKPGMVITDKILSLDDTNSMSLSSMSSSSMSSSSVSSSSVNDEKTTTPKLYKTVKLLVSVLHHSTTIKPGYTAILNCHKQKQIVTIKDILNDTKLLRSGNRSEIIVEFRQAVYLNSKHLVILREGNSKAIGKIL